MTTDVQTWTEETVELAGAKIQLVKGGRGDPLLILHDEMGHPGWMRYHNELAKNNTLYITSHPGFGTSERLEWIMNMRDLAGWYLHALDDLNLGQINVMGHSLGGWLAAEMATMNPQMFKKLVLVGSAGIKPPTGDIFDMFLVVAKDFFTASVLDPASVPEFSQLCPDEPTPEQAEAWEVAREQSARLVWKPYMYYPALPRLLGRLNRLDTLIVWGREDPIVPLSAGQAYQRAIRGSRLEIIDNCGHRPEIEKPDEFVRLVRNFIG
jgi:pimeloyl-ACP methyl ester carboxylesterase